MFHGIFVVPYFFDENGILNVVLKMSGTVSSPIFFNATFEGEAQDNNKAFVGNELGKEMDTSIFLEPRFEDVECFNNGAEDKTEVLAFRMKSYSMTQLLCERATRELKEKGYCDAFVCVPASIAMEAVADKWVIESAIDHIGKVTK